MWSIASRELKSLFISPLAWAILGVVQFILALAFSNATTLYKQPEVQTSLEMMANPPGLTYFLVGNLYGMASIVLLLVMPLLTMRLISDERRNKTLPLLLTAPISMRGIIFGKFFGLVGFFAVMLGMITLMPLALFLGSPLDFGQIASAALGMVLLVAAFTAIGLYISTLTAYPTVAAIYTFGVLFFLWIVDWIGEMTESPLWMYLSIQHHFHPLLTGLFSTENVIYFLLLTLLFLILSIHRLDSDRL
jgi:ABC-2 type transport system permease protein